MPENNEVKFRENLKKQQDFIRNAEGIQRVPAWFMQRGQDIGRGIGDVFGISRDFWAGKDPSESSLLGTQLFGPISGTRTATESIRRSLGGETGALTPGTQRNSTAGVPAPRAPMTASQYLAETGAAFDSSPYDNYANNLAQIDARTLAQINAMYKQLAESAGENVERIKDIYGGAEQGVGETYGGAIGTAEDAYASAQQQAADQLARLGIEEAAPQVVNPMALSQAETISNLASNQAAGLGAVQRFGATGQDFASQMAQVGQQQGLEATGAILRDMAQRQAELAFQREQARAQFNPYESAMQRLQFEQSFYEPQMRAQQAEMDAQIKAQELQLNSTLSRRDKITSIWTDIRDDFETDEEALAAAEAAVRRAEELYPLR